jgi:hypothetical protein
MGTRKERFEKRMAEQKTTREKNRRRKSLERRKKATMRAGKAAKA